MAKVSRSIVVQAPLELVFDIVADPDMAVKHVPNIIAIRDRTPGPIRMGSRWRQRMRVAGQETEMAVEVVEYRRPDRCTVEMLGAAGMRALATLTLTTRPDGTLVEQSFDYDVPGGVFGAALGLGRIMGSMIERDVAENQRILKQVVEAMAAAQPGQS